MTTIPAATQFPGLTFVTAFADAQSHGERADLLLRMPLTVMCDCRAVLEQTCRATGFAPGADYIRETVGALRARRGADGTFPDDLESRIAATARPLIEFAEAWRPVTEADGTCRAIGECTCPATRAAREACSKWRWK